MNPIRIMIVGDEAEDGHELKRLLEANGYRVTSDRTKGKKGAARDGEDKPDAALMGSISLTRMDTEKGAGEEKQFPAVLQTAMDGFWMSDMQGRLLDVNETYCRISGYSREELLTMRISDLEFVHPEDRAMVDRAYSDSLKSGMPYEVDHRLLMRDGRVKWVHEVGRTEYDKAGHPLRSIGSVQEITERKQAEERIEKERENFLKIFAAAPVGLLLLDADTVIHYANRNAAALVLSDPAEMIGKRGGGGLGCIHSIENPNGCGFGRVCPECPLRNGLESVLASGQHIHDAEINITLLISGTPHKRWLKINVEPIEIDDRQFVIVAIDDITGNKQAEEQIRRNDARLRSIVNILQYRVESVREFLDYALDEAIMLTESRIGYVYYYHEDRQTFVLNSWSKDVMRECAVVNPETCYALDKTGVWGEAVRQRKPLILNDFQPDCPLKKGYPEGHVHLSRFMTVPVFREDRIVAVVGVANKIDAYDEQDVLQLSLLMDAVWKSVEKKKGEEALRESEAVNAALAELSTALLSAESIDVIAELVLYHGKQLTRSRHGFVGHIDHDSGHLISTTLSHDIWNECRVTDKTYVFEHFKGLWGWVLNNQTPLLTNTPAGDSRSMGIPDGHLPIERFVSVPVMLEGRLQGQIALANADRDYTEKDVQTLHRLADAYSLALQRLRAEQELQQSHALLEERVATRTAELERANRSLKAEIKKRKLLEAETVHKSRLASVGELAAGVAHEINNPINVIINYAQILTDESPDPQNPQSIPRRIMKEGDRVAAIVRNLLNFAKESDDAPGFCDIAEIVDDSLELMRKQLDKDGIRVSVTMPDRPPPVIAIFHKMQQVFVNLIGNARHALNAKYSGVDEGKSIEIESRVEEYEGRSWMRTIFTDNGLGIPEKNLGRIFEPFFSTKPKGEGTGLGLSISYGIVRENGGNIAIESVEGNYTRVIIDLPLASYDRVIRPATNPVDNNG